VNSPTMWVTCCLSSLTCAVPLGAWLVSRVRAAALTRHQTNRGIVGRSAGLFASQPMAADRGTIDSRKLPAYSGGSAAAMSE
jgi:hypothetical protein